MAKSDSLTDAELRSSFRALIARESGSSEPIQHAFGAARVCATLFEHFARLVGRNATRALFERSAALTQERMPMLDGPGSDPADPPWQKFLERAGAQPGEVALDGSVHLVTTFLQSLAQLVGTGLVMRLLHELWPDDFSVGHDGAGRGKLR